MDPYDYFPRSDDHCAFCLRSIPLPWDTVLVPDDRDVLSWWHLDCRDRSLGLGQEGLPRVLDA